MEQHGIFKLQLLKAVTASLPSSYHPTIRMIPIYVVIILCSYLCRSLFSGHVVKILENKTNSYIPPVSQMPSICRVVDNWTCP